MAIEGFDYKGFAESMAEQAKELVPAELKDFEKDFCDLLNVLEDLKIDLNMVEQKKYIDYI